ncbi:McbB family protein [Terasakiispira papahanaumokuakeensis]|uniref:McbB family protein n=1 Tax=Terasakiispira papahanaumokuakeensis TaxID=197479 RepID=UPI000A07B53B|nr:McbB family protein [Terasakiispira papahanaumokuakeensis]
MKSYYQKPFNIQEGSSGSLVYSSGGAVNIENEPLAKMIINFFKKEGQYINSHSLQQWCSANGLERNEVISFLINDAKLLCEISEDKDIHKEIIVVANYNNIDDLSEALSDVSPYDIIKCPESDIKELSGIISSCIKPMVVFYSEDYSKEAVLSLYSEGNKSENPEVSFSTSYFLHDSFIVDAIFSPKKNTPCHFCHYDMWYDQALNREFTSKSSWFSFYKKANDANWPIRRSLPVSKINRYTCFFHLKRKISPFFGSNLTGSYPEELVSFFQLRLPSGLSHSDIVPHSTACSCSGGKYVI